MPYDNFSSADVPGLFSLEHLLFVMAFVLIAILSLYLSKKIDSKYTKKILFVIAIAVTIMEIVKIAIRVYKKQPYDDYIPVYFCSLFIYAIWMVFIKNKYVERMGYTFMVFGGIFASIVFSLYPTTSLLLYPIWHPATIHSFVYHTLMFFSGCLVANSKLYTPNIKDSYLYTGFLSVFCIIGVILNHYLNTNMMFLSNPFGLPLLSDLASNYNWLYILVVYLAESVLLYWINYGVYKLIKRRDK